MSYSQTALEKIQIRCPLDQTMQCALLLRAAGSGPRPLVIALHTWSYSISDGKPDEFAESCRKRNFHLIYPDFRGPNWTPQALGSDLAVADIVAAVEYGRQCLNVDEARIYLIGGSGGGHMALLMAGRHPELWTAVSAWCPITDVAAWHASCAARNLGYAKHIEQACGGNPPDSGEMRRRSPMTYLAHARAIPVNIGTGIHDGHSGSVPVSHSLNAFNALAAAEDRFTPEEIAFVTGQEAVPVGIPAPEQDPAYPKIHLRRFSGNAGVTVFEGGHDLLTEAGIAWLAGQRRGCPPVWTSGTIRNELSELSK